MRGNWVSSKYPTTQKLSAFTIVTAHWPAVAKPPSCSSKSETQPFTGERIVVRSRSSLA
jgi:hypothetical protein